MSEQLAKLAKVARPAVRLEPCVNVRVYPQLGKHVRKILQTLAKVRQAKLKGSDPGVKLMAETAGGHKPAQGNVAGSNQAGLTSRAAVEVLQAHKKLILRRWPESSNMLQVKAAEAQLLGCARGELLRRASDERPRSDRRKAVQLAGDLRLAAARLSHQQNSAEVRCNASDLNAESLCKGAFPGKYHLI